MRYQFIILFLLVGFISKAQVYQLMPQYGYSTYRMNFDSTIQIPTFCGVPKLGSNKINKGALAFDSCNNRFYFFNPKSQAWDTIKSGSTVDTTKFVRYTDTSAMLLPYLRKVDTTNKWVSSVTKLNDSTIQVIKGTTTSNITIGSVTSATRLITQVWNNTGATILRGSVVYISGRHSSNLPTIALAEGNNESNSYKTFALVDGDIPDNSSGFVIQAGKIAGLNLPTSSYTDGDILYLSPTVAGGYTKTKPLAPNHIVKLGSVTRAHPTQGSIEIKIENGWQLDELSDVQIAAVPLDSTILQFSRVDSLWHDVNPTTAMGNRFVKRTDSAAMLQPYLRKSDTLSISNRINLKLNISDTSAMLSPYLRSIDTTNKYVTSVFRKTASDSVFFVRGGSNNFAFRDSTGAGSGLAIGSAITSATSGSVLYAGTGGTLRQSNTQLFYDSTNARLGIGTTTPANKLDVNGTSIFRGISRIQTSGSSNYIDLNSNTTGSNIFLDASISGVNDYRIEVNGNTAGTFSTSFGYKFGLVNGGFSNIGANVGTFQSNVNILGGSAQLISTSDQFIRFAHRDLANRGTMGFAASTSYLQIRTGGSTALSNGTLSTIFDNVGSVGIGGITTVNSSAQLEMSSTTKGFLPPRMTSTQRDAISTPAAGLIIYNTTTNKHQGYNGTIWNDFY